MDKLILAELRERAFEPGYADGDKLILLLDHIYPTMMVAHGEGYASTLHRFGEPCALCRPPIEITDEMVERARKASFDGFRSALIVPLLRAALEAALNG